MKANYEKHIHEQWLKTKYTCEGVKAVVNLISDHYNDELHKLPEEEQKNAVIDLPEFLHYLEQVKEELLNEFGV